MVHVCYRECAFVDSERLEGYDDPDPPWVTTIGGKDYYWRVHQGDLPRGLRRSTTVPSPSGCLKTCSRVCACSKLFFHVAPGGSPQTDP